MNHLILQGDALTVLKSIPDGIAQTCVTSPPYFGLRDYGVEGQIGLEETPDAFVQKLVEVFREVRRVLKDDGTLWLNLGDSYASQGLMDNGAHKGLTAAKERYDGRPRNAANDTRMNGTVKAVKRNLGGLKPKDLIGIPWRVAFALQQDGWYLRQDIIWHKPNPMPESVTDRCTKAHEYIFLLSKSQHYYFDHEAIKETSVGRERFGNTGSKAVLNADRNDGARNDMTLQDTRNKRSVWTVTTKPYKGAHFATFPPDLIEPCILAGSKAGDIVLDPFTGSGTTGAVAIKHGRRFQGIELNPEYIKLAEERIGRVVMPLPLMEAAE